MPGYSPRIALDDLIEGAFRARRPVRRRRQDGVAARWQALLLALDGLVQSIVMFVREPFQAADFPAGGAWLLPLANGLLLPLLAVTSGFTAWFVSTLGAWIVLGRRIPFREIGTATTLGLWASALPCIAAIAVSLALGVSTESIDLIVALVVLIHTVPSLAEMGGLTIGRAFVASLLGPLLLFLAGTLAVVASGFVAKFVGLRP